MCSIWEEQNGDEMVKVQLIFRCIGGDAFFIVRTHIKAISSNMQPDFDALIAQ